MDFKHRTVLISETIANLNINPDGVYVDCTAGGGGLSYEIASRLSSNGKLICIDQDPDAISVCEQRLKSFKNVIIVHGNFSNISYILHDLDIDFVDGIVLDIGVSSYQLDSSDRGFSYKYDAVLDMRMSKSGLSAYDVVNNLDYIELKNIIRTYGEEEFASRIAGLIIKKRNKKPIETTCELAEIVSESIPCYARRRIGHPARKTFQAIRIYVNNELDNLKKCLDQSINLLNKHGRIIVITFHSLEDRIVKEKMLSWVNPCTCPSDFPTCICCNKPKAKLFKKKPIVASEQELLVNHRSRSAKMRVCIKV